MTTSSGTDEMPKTIKCAIYARFSTHHQRDASIDDQVRKCMDAAASRGWEVLADQIYADKAISAKSIGPRVEFKKLLSVATNGSCPFNRILVDDTSRVARNTKEALDVFSLLTFYNIHVYYVAQGIDTSHESAEQMITINGMIDSLYLRNLAKQVHRGIEGQVLKGYSGGGRRYGYRSAPVHSGKVDIYGRPEADGYRLVIIPEEAETVIRIFQLFAESGFSGRKIVRILNTEVKETGVPKPPRGKWWTISTIQGSRKYRRGILNNEIYIGRYYWNCSRSVVNPLNGKRSSRLNEGQRWQLVSHPSLAIISKRLWDKVKARQKAVHSTVQGRYTKAKTLYSLNLLTGLLKCSECGGNIVIVSGGRFGKYGCTNNWNRGLNVCANGSIFPKIALEERVVTALIPDLTQEPFSDYLLGRTALIVDNKTKEASPSWEGKALRMELAKTEKEIANVINAIKAGIQSELVKKALETLESKKSLLELKLKKAENSCETKSHQITRAELIQYLKYLRDTLIINPSLARDALRILIGKN